MNTSTGHDSPADDPLVGTIVDGRYRVVGLLGRGGMGAVYRCDNIRLHGRPCAMKVLAGLGTPRERLRFDREIRTISQLRSLHTVPVFDSGVLEDERPFVVMELLEGRDLDEALAGDARPSLAQALVVADQVLTALVEAHALGIVHRDLKPANLFLVREGGSEVAKVLDFGIAKQERDAEPALTRGNASMGTPRYMAPEQFRNEGADARTDLYALGLIVYEMIVGRRPFQADDPVPSALDSMPVSARLAWMHLNREPPLVNGLSPALQSWLSSMLSKDRSDRPPDARTAREALRVVPEFGGTPGGGMARPGRSTLTGASHAVGRRRWGPVIAGVSLGGLGLLALILIKRAAAPTVCVEQLVTDPPGAVVLEDGQPIGTTPLELERTCGASRTVRIEHPTFEATEIRLHGPTGMALDVIDLVEVFEAVAVEPADAAPPADMAVDAAPKAPARRRKRPRRRTRATAPKTPAPADPVESTGGLDF